MLLFLLPLLFVFSDASMTCEDGYDPIYFSAIPGWQVLCCWSGVKNGKCFPESPYDYYASCQAMFSLTNGYQCNCGSLCSGVATRGQNGNHYCEGSCTCPLVSGCNNTLPPSNTTKQVVEEEPSSNSAVSFMNNGFAFVLMGFFLHYIVVM